MDDRTHPSEVGTKDLLGQIDKFFKEEIIISDNINDVAVNSRYRFVDKTYKVGCRGCDSLDFTPYLCDECKQDSSLVNIDLLMQKTLQITATMYPDGLHEYEEDMVEIDKPNGNERKRELSDNKSEKDGRSDKRRTNSGLDI